MNDSPYVGRMKLPFDTTWKNIFFISTISFIIFVILIVTFQNGINPTGKIIQTNEGDIIKIIIKNGEFKPSFIEARKGDVLLFENTDDSAHFVMSKYWKSELLFNGDYFAKKISNEYGYEFFLMDRREVNGFVKIKS